MIKKPLFADLIESCKTITNEQKGLAIAFERIELLLLGTFNAERLSIFQRRPHHRDLVSRFKTGTEVTELKVPINTHSIAGYVAMAQQAIIVNHPYDKDTLRDIYFKLRFEKKYDRLSRFKTKNVLCVPINHGGILLGVLQILNRQDGDFDVADMSVASDIADILGTAFRYELGGTARPFDYLIHRGIIEPKMLSNLSKNSSIKQTITFLNNEYNIAGHDIGEALSIYYQVPFIDFKPDYYEFSENDAKLSVSYLKRNLVTVIKDKNENTVILMFEPNNNALLMEIESTIGTDNYQLAFSLPTQILKYLGETNAQTNPTKFDEIIGEIDTSVDKINEASEDNSEDEPAIVRLVSNILFEAKRLNASDIHIDPESQGPTQVRMRVDGIMRDINTVPQSLHNAVISRIKIMSRLNIAEKRIPQDGKLIFNIPGQSIEVRVATLPTVAGEGAVMRLLQGGDALPIEKLNLSARNKTMVQGMVSIPHGIMLVVGPTGSGKTTTLHAILGYLNTPDKKIWTAEDPVEITQYRLQQVQVNPKIGFTFAKALRAFLRADPDVILIGEMRDKETAHAGIEASLTGHLVLSTLHTNSAPETITRLLDLGIDPVNFSDACVGILAQRLIRTLCVKCKEHYSPSEPEKKFLIRQYGEEYIGELDWPADLKLCRAKGCRECDETGYKGRTGVHELLSMTPDLRGLIYKEASIAEMKEQAMRDGMRTLTQDAVLKVLKGDTDINQAQILSGAGMWQHKQVIPISSDL